jgi:iodothyronine deiodinase-like protein
VYIGEAHPSDLWQVPNNLKDRVILSSPANEEERMAAAELCVTKLSIDVPALVDHFSDATERAYTGWPERLYLIDRGGRVAYKSRPGPFGFRLTELEESLRAVVTTSSTAPASSRAPADTADRAAAAAGK